jgi:hypothetical protein
MSAHLRIAQALHPFIERGLGHPPFDTCVSGTHFKMPPDMTREFFSAVQDQLASHASGEVRLQEWMRFEPVELVKRITMRHCGK